MTETQQRQQLKDGLNSLKRKIEELQEETEELHDYEIQERITNISHHADSIKMECGKLEARKLDNPFVEVEALKNGSSLTYGSIANGAWIEVGLEDGELKGVLHTNRKIGYYKSDDECVEGSLLTKVVGYVEIIEGETREVKANYDGEGTMESTGMLSLRR